MATLYGSNAAKYLNTTPSEKVDVNQQHGRMRVSYDEHTFDGNPSSGDVIKMGRIPKGAKVYNVILVVHAALDAASTDMDLGWNGGVNGDETADEDGFFTAVDSATGALVKQLLPDAATSVPAGYGKEFADDVDIELSFDAAPDGADGDKVSVEVHYVLD